jgi:hypothetical protein
VSEVINNSNGQNPPLSLAGDYFTVIGGDCAANGQITLSLGQIATCTITNRRAAYTKVTKTFAGLPLTGSQSYTFEIRTGASAASDGTTIASCTANAANNGTCSFGIKLDPLVTYNFCETNLQVGFNTSLTNAALFPQGFFLPPNGGVNSTTCVSFGAGIAGFTLTAGQTLTFNVDNTPPPGGQSRTIGYWKNWSSCDGKGKQAPTLDRTLAKAEPGGVPVGDLILHGSTATPDVAPDCLKAIAILDKSDIISGRKMASDPAYNMAAQFLGAELNYLAGAAFCQASTAAIQSSQALLDAVNFTGTGAYAASMTTDQKNIANTLGSLLDAYNNNNFAFCASHPTLAGIPLVSVFTSANNTTISSATGGSFTVTATGSPTPTLSVVGPLPAGVTFVPGTGSLNVAIGTAPGVYTIKFAATNWGVVYQTFTLTVNP